MVYSNEHNGIYATLASGLICKVSQQNTHMTFRCFCLFNMYKAQCMNYWYRYAYQVHFIIVIVHCGDFSRWVLFLCVTCGMMLEHDIKNTFTYQNEIKVSVWIFRDKIVAIYRSLANRILSRYFENDIASRIRNEDNKLIPIRKDWTHAYWFTLTTLPIYDMWVNDSVPTTIFIPKYVYISIYIWICRCSVILFQ